MSSLNDYRFFCIRGYMKSGTNWLGNLVSSHRNVSVVGEFHWTTLVRALNRTFRLQPIFSQKEYREVVRKNFDDMIKLNLIAAAPSGKKMIGERTPSTIAPVVMRGVPHVSIVRDGRDVLVSRAYHLFNNPQETLLFGRFPEMHRDLEAFQRDPWYFKNHPERLLRHETMVCNSIRWWGEHVAKDRQTAKEIPGLPLLFVRYEDLHRDVEAERTRVFRFLKLNPQNAREIDSSLRPGFDREKPDDFNRNGIVGDWKNYFTDQTKQWFKEHDGGQLVSEGYEASNDW